MTIAKELEDRMWYLADPAVKWVQRTPTSPDESCLLMDGEHHRFALSSNARYWLDRFLSGTDGDYAIGFNDRRAKSRDDVIERLQEAVDQAKWEGV